MRDKLIRFMMGRYGMDNLNNCLLWSSLVLLIIATFTRLGLLTLISYVLMIIVIYRMLSRKIYQRENENKIYVVDSKCASSGQGLLAILAREKADQVDNVKKVVDFVEATKLKISHLFVVDSLKYLARTGRISKVTATIGTVLQIKPVLQ